MALWKSLDRFEWGMKNALVITTDEGHEINLVTVCPRDVLEEVKAGVLRWQLRKVCAHRGYHDIWLKQWRKQLFNAEPKGRGALRKAALAGGFWTRARLHGLDLATDPHCAACLAQGVHKIDTPAHRWWDCTVTDSLQETQLYDDLSWLEGADADAHYMLATGIPWYGLEPGLAEELTQAPLSEVLEVGDSSVPWSGTLFLDGSGYEPTQPELRRCGWSMVMVDEEGALVRATYGPLPGAHQTVPRAEHFALEQFARLAEPGSVAVTDCKGVAQNHAKGEAAQAPHEQFAGVWRSVHNLSRGWLGPDSIRWMPAHCTEADVQEGKVGWLDWVGNAYADEWAKNGAKMHRFRQTCVDHIRLPAKGHRMSPRMWPKPTVWLWNSGTSLTRQAIGSKARQRATTKHQPRWRCPSLRPMKWRRRQSLKSPCLLPWRTSGFAEQRAASSA